MLREEEKVSKDGLNIGVSTTLDLDKLLDYQDGSVVSRTLINKNAGTVSLFSFDKGEGLSEHSAPFDALVYVFEGKADVIIAKESHVLTGGQMILMPANVPHALNALDKFKMMLIMIKSNNKPLIQL